MRSEWKEFRLGDITEWASGGTPSKQNADFWNGTIPWISASSMGSNRYNESDLKITQEGLKAGSRLAKKDSILLLVRGSTLHQRIPVGIATSDVSFNQDVKAIKAKEEFIDPWYLLFWFMAKEKDLLNMVENTGIGAGKLDTNRLQNLLIRIPPDAERDKILLFARALDDKILLNRQINQTLETMAQAIFKSWFVDFEPVKAKISAIEAGEYTEGVTRAAMSAISDKTNKELGRLQAEQLEYYTQLKTTAEIFPSTMQDSELGKIPKGWEAGCFGDVIVQSRSRIQDRSAVVLSAVASGQLVPSDEHFTKKVYSESIEKYFIVEKWDFAYNPSRINIGSIGMHKKDELGAVSPVYVVFRPGADYRWFIEFSLKLNKTKNWINTLASGSVRQSLSFNDFASIPSVIPSKGCISIFNLLWEKLEEIMEIQINEINALKNLRDILLPKLISGEQSVDAAEFAEEN